jgi:hypothetical protein
VWGVDVREGGVLACIVNSVFFCTVQVRSRWSPAVVRQLSGKLVLMIVRFTPH